MDRIAEVALIENDVIGRIIGLSKEMRYLLDLVEWNAIEEAVALEKPDFIRHERDSEKAREEALKTFERGRPRYPLAIGQHEGRCDQRQPRP